MGAEDAAGGLINSAAAGVTHTLAGEPQPKKKAASKVTTPTEPDTPADPDGPDEPEPDAS